jgi:hypothetical protein
MPNTAVNSDAFFVRYAHYKCTGYGCISVHRESEWKKLEIY